MDTLDREQIIKKGLEQMLTTKEIGKLLGGLSKQRVYQLMERYGLSTPERKKKNYWKEQTDQMKWLSRTLNSKNITAKTKDEIVTELEHTLPEVCPVLDIKLVYGNIGIRQDNSASIDRFDTSKPYQAGNVSIVSWRANRIKNDGTAEDHKRISEWMYKNLC